MNEALAGVRAVICDIYGTLLAVETPGCGPLGWEGACQGWTGRRIPLEMFNARCAALTAEANAVRRQAGEPYPEVDWFAILRGVVGGELPGGAEALRLLSNHHARCVRHCTAMPGAVEALRHLHDGGVRLGMASNAQDYTRWEMENARVPLEMFDPPLCFLSGDHGFAKPSPRVFATLSEKLAALGIAPHETLMVGDSLENDIIPAAAAGWRTWHLGPRTWAELLV